MTDPGAPRGGASNIWGGLDGRQRDVLDGTEGGQGDGGWHNPGPFIPPPNWGLPPSFGSPKPADLNPGAHELNPGTYNLNPGAHELNPGTYNLNPDAHELNPGTYNLNPDAHELNPGTYNLNPDGHKLQPLDPASIPHAGGLPYSDSDIDRQAQTYKDLRDSGTIPFVPPPPEVQKRINELDAGKDVGKSVVDSSGRDVLKMDPDGLKSSAERLHVTGEGIQKLADKVNVGDGAAKCLPNTGVAQAYGRLDEVLKSSFRDAGVWPQSSAAKLHDAVKEVHGTDLEAMDSLKQVRDAVVSTTASVAK